MRHMCLGELKDLLHSHRAMTSAARPHGRGFQNAGPSREHRSPLGPQFNSLLFLPLSVRPRCQCSSYYPALKEKRLPALVKENSVTDCPFHFGCQEASSPVGNLPVVPVGSFQAAHVCPSCCGRHSCPYASPHAQPWRRVCHRGNMTFCGRLPPLLCGRRVVSKKRKQLTAHHACPAPTVGNCSSTLIGSSWPHFSPLLNRSFWTSVVCLLHLFSSRTFWN